MARHTGVHEIVSADGAPECVRCGDHWEDDEAYDRHQGACPGPDRPEGPAIWTHDGRGGVEVYARRHHDGSFDL